jgi:bifunctional non-homologous end joining protein LigD
VEAPALGQNIPFRISPMLATLQEAPFHKVNWVYEEKYDGVRILAYKEGKQVTLISRNAVNRTSSYPEIAAAVATLSVNTILLDGEVVVFDTGNVSRFKLLQQGLGERQYAVFDCLYANGRDLREETLSERRKYLEKYVKPSRHILLSKRLDLNGLKAFQFSKRRGLEGLVAKNDLSKYSTGRSSQWIKVKINQEQEFVIGGFTKPGGSRHYFGALLLGWYRQQKLEYAGKVGTGFNEKSLEALYAKLNKLRATESPFADDIGEKDAVFVAPRLVAQISFTEWTKEGKLRHPVYLGLRDDKAATQVGAK